MKRKTRKNILFGGSLKSFYGEMILKKDTILYHLDDKKFSINLEKPMLFLIFHPRDWIGKYITKIQLKKDISLFFMVNPINLINIRRIPSLLNTLTRKKNRNLNKQYDTNLKCYIKYLLEEKFDGWFSSIEGKTNVEISLINNIDIYNVISSELLNEDNSDKYEIHTIEQPIKLIINNKYKEFIERYKKQSIINNYNLTFQQVLKNADIKYIHTEIKKIHWDC